MEKVNMEMMLKAYNRSGELVESVNRTEIILKNVKSLVKSTAKTHEVISALYPTIDPNIISDVLKDIKSNLKGTKDTYGELFSKLEEQLSDLEDGYNFMRSALPNDDVTPDMIDIRNKVTKSTLQEDEVSNIVKAVNNPILTASHSRKDTRADVTVDEAIFTTLLQFASRGYTNLSDISILMLEAAVVMEYLNRNDKTKEKKFDLESILPYLEEDKHLIDLTVINSVGSFTVDGKELVPYSLILETLFEATESLLTAEELIKLSEGYQQGIPVTEDIVKYYINLYTPQPEVKEEESKEEEYKTDAELTEEELEKDTDNLYEEMRKTRERAEEAANKAYDDISSNTKSEVKKENSKTSKVLKTIGALAVCAIGGFLGYKYLTKDKNEGIGGNEVE